MFRRSAATLMHLTAAFTLEIWTSTAASNGPPVPSTPTLPIVITPENDAAAVEAVFRAMYRAMLAADTAALDAMLDEGFTLTHITGVVQPRRDWLADIKD